MIYKLAEALFLLTVLCFLALLIMLPIAMFAPARFARPWTTVSLLSVSTFLFAIAWLMLGKGCF